MTQLEYIDAAEAMRPRLLAAARAFDLSPEDAADVVASTLMYCLANLDEYRPEAAKLQTWVRLKLKHAAIDFLREEKLRHPPGEIPGFDPLEEDPGTHRRAQTRQPRDNQEPSYCVLLDERLDLERALAGLAPREREVVWRIVVEGYTARELALKLGLSHQRVGQILQSGLENMHLALGGASTHKAEAA